MFADIVKYSGILEIVVCSATLAAMARRSVLRDFPALSLFIAFTALAQGTSLSILFYRQELHMPRIFAYHLYFYSYWISRVGQFCLLVLIIFGLFSEAMRPFPGLQRIGKIIFRWVGAVSFLVATALAVGPQLLAKGVSTTAVITELASRFEQGINVLVLCLLIFVCFAIRPLGLTFRSRIFGVALGLGIEATVELVQSAWFVTTGAHSLYSPIYSVWIIGSCVAVGVWGVYFGLPEPERKMILLPTTSPFFLWNRISEILGDAPGQVAVAGFKPDMLAPAELEMLTAATSRETVSARQRQDALPEGAEERPARSDRSLVARPFLALSR